MTRVFIDVGDGCWKCVGDNFEMSVTKPAKIYIILYDSYNISVRYQYPKDVSSIEIPSSTP